MSWSEEMGPTAGGDCAGSLLYDHGHYPCSTGDDRGESPDSHSPWERIPLRSPFRWRFLWGIYLRYLRPGRIGEVSVIGLVFLIFAIISGVGGRKSDLGTVL
ncbi:hypothetical protein OHD25_01740 [Escherichia coli]|nr:hypothetical protein [Escherichia coli]